MADVNTNVSELKTNNKGSFEALVREYSKVRAGKANPGLLDSVMVSYYGQQSPISQMSSVSTPDARTIMIAPWDATALPEIEKAINASNLGFTPQNDGKVIRINIPILTEERRKEISKQISSMAEDARVGVRQHRKLANETVKTSEKDKDISEDESKAHQEDIQKETDDTIKLIDDLLKKKTSEIMTV